MSLWRKLRRHFAKKRYWVTVYEYSYPFRETTILLRIEISIDCRLRRITAQFESDGLPCGHYPNAYMTTRLFAESEVPKRLDRVWFGPREMSTEQHIEEVTLRLERHIDNILKVWNSYGEESNIKSIPTRGYD